VQGPPPSKGPLSPALALPLGGVGPACPWCTGAHTRGSPSALASTFALGARCAVGPRHWAFLVSHVAELARCSFGAGLSAFSS